MQSPQQTSGQQIIQLQQAQPTTSSQSGGIQIVQQIVTPTGEIQQIPVTIPQKRIHASYVTFSNETPLNHSSFPLNSYSFILQIQLTPQQLQMIRMQVQGGSNQPIIIQTAPIQTQPQLIQVAQGTTQAPVFLQTSAADNE